MHTIGIIAEYNPFHTGHAYHISQSRTALGSDCAVIAVMSGNWVQQAHCAILDKWTRARLALLGGADLVLELPTVWATASAEAFARGGVSLLHSTGVVTHLSFGSEGGQIAPLQKAAVALDTPEYLVHLSRYLDTGLSFPAARQKAAEELLGAESLLLSTPNNNLGIEYLRSLTALNSPILPMTVTRQGAAHNAISTDTPPFVSATHIRAHLMADRQDAVLSYLLPDSAETLHGFADLRRAERAVLARIRTMDAEDWAALPDSGASEGLPQRLERAGQQCTGVDHFLELAKTRRYTHARLRRLVLWAYLGLTADLIPQSPPYIRVLGFNQKGQILLKTMKKTASLPILTKPAHARTLSPEVQSLLELERRFTDLYDLCLEDIPPSGREWRTSPIIVG